MSKLVVRHADYNATGLITPILAVLISIPMLIRYLGSERFGILTLVWAIANYFGIFDLGLGRALALPRTDPQERISRGRRHSA